MNNTNIVNVSDQDKPDKQDIPLVKKKRGRPRKYPIDTTKPKIKKKEVDPRELKIKKLYKKIQLEQEDDLKI